jgi:hypothetical protein
LVYWPNTVHTIVLLSKYCQRGKHHRLLHLLCRYAALFLISLLPWFLPLSM